MEIDKKTVKYISDLARIELDEKQQEYFAPQLTKIIHYVDAISVLDLDAVEPLHNVHDTADVTDEDEVISFNNIQGIIDNFPSKIERAVKIKKVI